MSHAPQIHAVHEQVRLRYGSIASQRGDGATCCESAGSCSAHLGYSDEELVSLPPGADMGLGSGHPVAAAALQPGEVVLDLGSGGGIDCFLAARHIGQTGRVIGVDMTDAMLEKARAAAEKAGLANVEFRRGQIESLPVQDASVDVVISNCVVNLSPDKPAVWREVARVLKPGGRVAISDIVASARLPEAMQQRPELLCGCIGGAAAMEDVAAQLTAAGLMEVRIEPTPETRRPISQWIDAVQASDVHVMSAMIHGRKPSNRPTHKYPLHQGYNHASN